MTTRDQCHITIIPSEEESYDKLHNYPHTCYYTLIECEFISGKYGNSFGLFNNYLSKAKWISLKSPRGSWRDYSIIFTE